jgi:hypothetical protein
MDKSPIATTGYVMIVDPEEARPSTAALSDRQMFGLEPLGDAMPPFCSLRVTINEGAVAT